MNLPRFSVRHPVFVTMSMLIVVLLGSVSLSRLPIDILPKIELPTLSIRTEYENASPEVVERLVTQIIEETVAAVPGVEEITSISAEGQSNVRVRFGWGTDLNAAADDVRDRLDSEANELPDDITRPQLRKFDIANYPVVILGVASKLDPVELTELIDLQVQYRIERLPGVASVDLWGGFEREIRVSLDPNRAKALGLPLDQVLAAVSNWNLDLPAGEIEQGKYEVTLRAPAEFTDLDQISDTVIAVREGAPISLGQIAEIEDTYQKLTRIVRINGQRGLRLGVRKQADANTVEVSQRILKEVERINQDFPQIEMVPVINQGTFIERSITNVALSVLYGGFLAILVLLFFLRSLRSTLVISLAIPISVVATFALIYFGGLTINLMTLGGLALGIGMMVDSSIVVLENIFRRRDEESEEIATAADRGATEVGPAIVASTITTIVIFLPLIFVRGVTGILFSDLAYVIAFSLVCSLVVSLSLVPMLAAKVLPKQQAKSGDWGSSWEATAGSLFARFDHTYRDFLNIVLQHRVLTILFTVVLWVGSLLLVPMIGTEFLPPSDEGEVRVDGEMQVGTRLGLVDYQTQKMEAVVEETVPEAVASVVSVGASGYRPDEASSGEIRITLSAATERERSNVEIAADLRKRLAGTIPGIVVRTRAPQGQFLLNRVIGSDEGLMVEIRGYNLQTLDDLGEKVAEVLKEVPGITDVDTNELAGVPQQMIRVDRRKAALLGLTSRQVAEALETAIAGTHAGDYRTDGNSHRILVRLKDAELLSLDEILDLTLTTDSGEEIALRNVVNVEPGEGPIYIERKDQQRMVFVAANVAGRDLGSVVAELQEKLDTIARPVGYDFTVAGSYEQQEEAFQELILVLGISLLLVYMVLACQYESLRDPMIVMFSVPVAAIGVILTLFLTNTTLNVQSYIGCIMLGGIVVNNAILLVDQANQLRLSGKFPGNAAVAEAGRRRLRPILMTTLTTILGLLPLALGFGEGADAQAPLARAVIGGLAGSTVITLVLIPAIYSVFHPNAGPGNQDEFSNP